jgi:hypothetical protein
MLIGDGGMGMTHNIISQDVPSGADPADHLGGFDQWTKVGIVEQEVCRDGGPVGGITGWGWFVGTANYVFAGETLDAIGADDEVCFNELAGFEGEGGYGRIHGDDVAVGANGDTRMRLCELVDNAMKIGSLCLGDNQRQLGRQRGDTT